jgi:hypothetical protein
MADLSALVLPTSLTAEGLSAQDGRQLKSYLYQLTEQLRYVLANLDGDNMSAAYNASARAADVQLTTLTERQKADFDALRRKIIGQAAQIAHDYQSAITQADDALKAEVDEAYTARSESLQASLESLVSSEVSQTSREWNLSLRQVSTLLQQTADALTALESDSETWFRFTADGLEIGKSDGGAALPYTLRIDNEKLAFVRYGRTVAYLQYDRLYITAAEVSDRLSIGGSAGEGFFDFITTAAGLGIKWRAN